MFGGYNSLNFSNRNQQVKIHNIPSVQHADVETSYFKGEMAQAPIFRGYGIICNVKTQGKVANIIVYKI